MRVWCVWTESGAYEDFSRTLRGIFASPSLAEAHAAQLRDDEVEVIEDKILDEVPTSVPYVCYAAHFRPDGTEDTGPGYKRGARFSTWSNELKPLDSSSVRPWSTTDRPDLYVEVIGSDEMLVAAEYARVVDAVSPIQPFNKIRTGFEEIVAYRPGMDLGPDVGTLAWQDYRLARLVRRKVSVNDGADRIGDPGDFMVHREWEYLPDCMCGFTSECERHAVLTYPEREAAQALYESPIEVGHEGIGGFAAGQAEETVLALRLAGFPIG